MYHSTLRYLAISHFDKDINNIEIGWRKKKRINILLMGESGNWRRTLHWYWNAGTERENCFQYLPSLTHASSLLRFRVKINLNHWYKIQFNLRGKWLPVIRGEIADESSSNNWSWSFEDFEDSGSGGFVLGRSVTRRCLHVSSEPSNQWIIKP